MSSELDILGEAGWDRTCFNLSSSLSEPICQASRFFYFRLVAPLEAEQFENSANKASEIAFRILLGLGALAAIALAPLTLTAALLLGGSGKLLRFIGYCLQHKGYTHIRGTAEEKSLQKGENPKFGSWNHCGPGGGLSLKFGGVVDWRYRIDALVDAIEKEDLDLLCLEEYYDTAFMEALVERLKGRYAHFFSHLGANTWGSESGLLILSKFAVRSFSYTAFANNKWTLNRGFATLEIKASPKDSKPFLRVIGTHLIDGESKKDERLRLEQINQIRDSLIGEKERLPTLFLGDFNIERDGEEGLTRLSPLLKHGYLGKEPTCTNRFVAQWDQKARSRWDETIDYVSLFKEGAEGMELIDGHLIKAFDEDTKKPLSDHHGAAATLQLFS